ncbi:hypothetical protein ABH922_004964 [Rhodococcus sp. 27YEA15]
MCCFAAFVGKHVAKSDCLASGFTVIRGKPVSPTKNGALPGITRLATVESITEKSGTIAVSESTFSYPKLALSLAVGGDCLADIATVREQPAVFGPVASDATVSRLITGLAAAGPAALSAINSARAVARKSA